MKRSRGRPKYFDVLTPAEWRVADAVRHGMTNAEMSRRMNVSRDAIKFHLANILGKLSLATRSQLRHWHGVPVTSPLKQQTGTRMVKAERGLFVGIGQISRVVRDIAKAVEWYRNILGLPHLYTFGDLAFFDCGGTRLFLTSRRDERFAGDSIIYFETRDIRDAYAQLTSRGVSFRGAPHLIHRHASGTEEWMAFFEDLDGQTLALMSKVETPAAGDLS